MEKAALEQAPLGNQPADPRLQLLLEGLTAVRGGDFSTRLPHTGDPLPVRDAQGTAIGPATLIPAGTRPGHHSPIHDAFGLFRAEEADTLPSCQ